jgi:S1-C subfamily serine protease
LFGGLLVADAPSTGASAGGAVVDAQGDVAGIVLAPAAGRSTTYAVPITVALAVAQDLRDDGRVAHGALEVLGTDTERGAMVTGVAAGSTAERAGIAVGDVVVAIDDRPVVAMGELTATVRRYAPGTEVTLSVWRGDRPEQLVVELASTLVETTT